jgi:hypothetical protein
MVNVADWVWLPYVFAVLTTAFVARCFWEDRSTVRPWHAVGTALLIVGLLGSIGLTRDDTPNTPTERADAPTDEAIAPETTAEQPPVSVAGVSTSLVSGTAVPAQVQGATESRSDLERIVSCETALAQIAAAIRQTSPDDLAPGVPDDGAISGDGTDAESRLQNCQVRLEAIAATLPR